MNRTPLSIITIAVTPFEQNARVIIDRNSRKALIVDPGGDVDSIISIAAPEENQIEAILLTHAHLDHAGGVTLLLSKLSQRYQQCPPLLAHKNESQMRATLSQQAMMFGLNPNEFLNCREPEKYLVEEDTVKIGEFSGKVLFTPGHSPGHIVLFFEQNNLILENIDRDTLKIISKDELCSPMLIAGDTLFTSSIGRTDLPGGDHQTLLQSIREKIFTLPSNTIVMPGHGTNTTVGIEAKSNPFLI